MGQSSGYLFPIFFVVWWCLISYLVSILSGWRRLAEIYRYEGTMLPGRIWRFQTLAMRAWSGYGSFIFVGADARGLYLSVLFLFRFGHPPLMLPWKDLSVRKVRFWGRTRLELRSRRADDVPIRIKPDLGEMISAASSGGFTIDRPGFSSGNDLTGG